MPAYDVGALEKRREELNQQHDNVSVKIDELERAMLGGDDDQRLIIAIGDRYKDLESIAFEQGKTEARLEFARDRVRDQANRPKEEKTEERLNAQEKSPSGQDWWRSSDRQDAAPRNERQPEPTRPDNDWWRSNSDDRDVEPDREPDRDR